MAVVEGPQDVDRVDHHSVVEVLLKAGEAGLEVEWLPTRLV